MNKIVIEQYIKNGVPDGSTYFIGMPNGEEIPLPDMESVVNFLKKLHGYQIVRRTLTIQEVSE